MYVYKSLLGGRRVAHWRCNFIIERIFRVASAALAPPASESAGGRPDRGLRGRGERLQRPGQHRVAWRATVVSNVSRVQCSTRRPRPHIAHRATPPPPRSAAPRVRWARRAGRGPGPRACCFWPRGWRPSLPTSPVHRTLRRLKSRAPPAAPTRTRENTAYE